MRRILYLKVVCNHEIALIQENSKYIVQNYSLVKSEAKTEVFPTFREAFARWNEICTKIIEEA